MDKIDPLNKKPSLQKLTDVDIVEFNQTNLIGLNTEYFDNNGTDSLYNGNTMNSLRSSMENVFFDTFEAFEDSLNNLGVNLDALGNDYGPNQEFAYNNIMRLHKKGFFMNSDNITGYKQNTAWGDVDILASVWDEMKKDTFLSVNSLSYNISPIDIQTNSVSTYKSFEIDYNFFDNPNTNTVSNIIFQREFSKYRPTSNSMRQASHYILTNTNGNTGAYSEIDETQFWNTNAKNGTATQNNGSDASQDALYNENAMFKDGKYNLNIIASDLNPANTQTLTEEIIVDNFAPYVKEVKMWAKKKNNSNDSTLFYDTKWEINPNNQSEIIFNQNETLTCDYANIKDYIWIEVIFSEFIEEIKKIRVEQLNGTYSEINFDLNTDTLCFGISGGKKGYTDVDEIGGRILQINAIDVSGNYIQILSSDTVTTPHRLAKGDWHIPLNGSSSTKDIRHIIKIGKPDTEDNKNTYCPGIYAEYNYSNDTSLTIQYTNYCTTNGETITYLWDFGDGNTSTEANPEHTYWASGEYDVTLTINSDLYNSSETKPVEVIANTTTDLIVPSENFPTIQSAIVFVDENNLENATVYVQPGTYTENINFLGLTNFSLIGDPTNPETTIIDGGGNGTVVTFNNGEDLTTILSGFTIQNGVSNTSNGGGIKCNNSSPKLDNLVISNNVFNTIATKGAGFYANNSNFELSNSTIESNGSLLSNCYGGGIYLNAVFGKITNVLINNNTAEYGGGISIHGSDCEINNLTVQNNTATNGGGIFTTSSMINNTDLLVLNNSAGSGCGIFAGSSTANNFKNIVLSGNSYTGKYISPAIQFYGGVDIANIENITIVNNKVGLYCLSDQINVRNCIIRDNINFDISAAYPVFVEYSNIGSKLEYPNNITWGDGNINTNPEFNNTTSKSDNYYLQPSSLCINTGNPETGYNDTDQTRNDMGACRNNITEYIVGDTTICQGSTKIYSIDASPNHQYEWSIPPTWEIVSGVGTNTIEVIAGEQSGDVFVTVTGNNQIVPSLHIPAEINLLPYTPQPIEGKAEPCIDSKVKYSISPISNASEYIWEYPSSWKNAEAENNYLSVLFNSYSSSGVVSVRGNNECGNGQASYIYISPKKLIQGPELVQVGVKTVTYFVENTNTYLFWKFPKGWLIHSGQGTNVVTVTPSRYSGFIEITTFDSFTNNNYCPLWVEMVNSEKLLSLSNNNIEIKVYPNPTSGIFTVETNRNSQIFISDISGKVIKNSSLNNTKHTIDLTNQPIGVYFLKIQTENGVINKKIIKN